MISFREGDLFGAGIPALAHGVNCRGSMGAGIAAQFRKHWPLMYESYRKRCYRGALIPGDVHTWTPHGGGTVVFNLATQRNPGPDAKSWMITAAVGRMITEAHHDFKITEIAMPMIGCGIGGLTENELRRCLEPYADAPVNLTVMVLPYADAVAV